MDERIAASAAAASERDHMTAQRLAALEERAAAAAAERAAAAEARARIETAVADAERATAIERVKAKQQAEAAAAHREATAGGGMGMAMPGGDGSGYVDWLKKKMMRAQTGMNEDELDWEFKVDNKQVGNSFLHAEAEEKLAQQEYGQLMSEKDAFDR